MSGCYRDVFTIFIPSLCSQLSESLWTEKIPIVIALDILLCTQKANSKPPIITAQFKNLTNQRVRPALIPLSYNILWTEKIHLETAMEILLFTQQAAFAFSVILSG